MSTDKCPKCGGLNGGHSNYRCPAMTLEYAQNNTVEVEQRWIKVCIGINANTQGAIRRLKKLIIFYQGKYAMLKEENNKLRKQLYLLNKKNQ